jgi:hypothetical protein
MRRGLVGPLCALALVLPARADDAPPAEPAQRELVWAELVQPTDRYDHGVLGDKLEWGALRITVNTCIGCAGLRLTELVLTLPESRVFEDVEARVADLDGDGRREVVVVETDLQRGASLSVWNETGRIAATPFIGAPHRWLAPAGIADFDGDGRVEIAYVDRPHILGDLVYVRLEAGKLREVARLPGVSNHRIGDKTIAGGVRDCGKGVELVLAANDWSRLVLVGWQDGPVARDGGEYSAAAMKSALVCG